MREIDRLMDKDEISKEKLAQEKQSNIDLKRTIEKMEDERNSKSGIASVLDGFRGSDGSIDMAGLGAMIKGAGEGISAILNKNAGGQLAGGNGINVPIPTDAVGEVNEIVAWYVRLMGEQRQQAFTVLNMLAANPELMIRILNPTENGTRSAKAI